MPVFYPQEERHGALCRGVRYKPGADGREEEILNEEDFRRIISAYDVNDDYLFTKLYVPKRYFSAQSFGSGPMLPGYE